MAKYSDEETGFSQGLLRLTGLPEAYRILREWQSEFKPRRYETQCAPIPIERREVRLNSRRRR